MAPPETTLIGAQHAEHASTQEFDLIVVGGGITGAWATLLASRAGLRVCLVEARDFGAGTSRVSHRILHGGFRYLQSLDLPRLRESVEERAMYAREFPDLVTPLACLMPLYGQGLKRPGAFKAASIAYELLKPKCDRDLPESLRLPPAGVVSGEQTLKLFPLARPDGLKGGGVWHDAMMRSHPRILMSILRKAGERGAVALNHTPARELLTDSGAVSGVRAVRAGRSLDLRAKAVLDTTGTSAGQWTGSQSRADVPAALAFNLLLDREPVSSHAVAITPPATESDPSPRTYFLVARSGRIAAGTTHVPARGASKDTLVSGMLDDLNRAAPGLDLNPSDVLRIDAGLLPTERPGDAEPSDRPTVIDHAKAGGPRGLATAVAVKYTTARRTAAEGLRLLGHEIAVKPHGGSPGASEACTTEPAHSLLLDPSPSLDTLLASPDTLAGFCQAEGVQTLEDLVLGRTEWGELPAHAESIAEPLFDALAPLLRWDPAQKPAQLRRLAHAARGDWPKVVEEPPTSGDHPAP
ncbi:MAG: FAD-dependent oxidoreductase [Phycisphaerales bacterium JB040]